ncbi:HMG box protein, putative [Talaromyces stipitatus ATCC 10500]|uniref:HMG box protein, putative n=1 Tax=Talaromyces stipitatus (strain ATCC 10500 / CBS 375.48 / QM 6759 / NRRL 1006) TaxID=441959 RepID=B8LUU9_TALSN|nr:HMG box protein, putative [Talaromyces stipitatus ATCC 10500]XP_002341429.1 HMG box protein, putative [Talaromyces stipitatus ATCC 10500]EED24041.1 HMG box protein, putative [Talaromyces stipitatus ATCC 10500]EED24042.1 HMG box protein, putative [Talaromyces stipitatus ATCC 10500]
MQLIFAARRGRRVLHQVDLQQKATLSTRAPIAVSHVRRVFRLADNRAAVPLTRNGTNTLKQLGAVSQRNQYATSTTTSSVAPGDTPAPKRRGRPPKSDGGETLKQRKPKKKKAKKVKKVRKLSEGALEKRREQRQAQKVKDTIKELIAEALKKEEPKLRSPIAWNLFVSEKLKGVTELNKGSALRDIAVQYRQLPDYQREALNQEAAKLGEENEKKLKEWIHSYTPLRIKQANAARKLLPKYMTKHEKSPIIKLSQIPDDRQVKRPVSAFLWFFKERVATGEYRGLPVRDIAERVKADWANTTDSEKQVYLAKAEDDRKRYITEYRETYGEEPLFIKEGNSKQKAEGQVDL